MEYSLHCCNSMLALRTIWWEYNFFTWWSRWVGLHDTTSWFASFWPYSCLQAHKIFICLCQANRQWNFKLTATFTVEVLFRSITDFIIVLTCVDDLILVGNNLSEITQLKSLLHNRFGIKKLWSFEGFLRFWNCTIFQRHFP